VREESIKGEIVSLEESFSGLEQDYYLLDKVGEGTFSSVYIAVDLKHQVYNNAMWNPTRFLKPRPTQPYIVAVKRIYVTASPDRIYNELKMLKEISGCKQIVPVVSAIRHKDQVLVVMPYVEHTDFRVSTPA
jgi:cell division control protein 7